MSLFIPHDANFRKFYEEKQIQGRDKKCTKPVDKINQRKENGQIFQPIFW